MYVASEIDGLPWVALTSGTTGATPLKGNGVVNDGGVTWLQWVGDNPLRTTDTRVKHRRHGNQWLTKMQDRAIAPAKVPAWPGKSTAPENKRRADQPASTPRLRAPSGQGYGMNDGASNPSSFSDEDRAD